MPWKSRPLAIFVSALISVPALCDTLDDTRKQGEEMLKRVKKDLEKYYFDPGFGGVDIQAAFAAAEQKMRSAQSPGHTFGIIAQALASLNDSHTFFIPPSRVAKTRYGWRMRMVGEQCLITAVKPGSDAAEKGMRPGDVVMAIEGFRPTRDNLWKMRYTYYTLQPRAAMRLALRGQDGGVREIEVAATIKTGKQVVDLTGADGGADYYEIIRDAQAEDRVDPHKTQRLGNDILIWRMPDFSLEDSDVDNAMARARAQKSLILDLRGNPGGYVTTLERVAGHLLGKEVVLSERKGRKPEKPIKTRTEGDRRFEGQVVVLVDSDSGSAAEHLARVIQIEKRGTVLGDRTSGSLRESRTYQQQLGSDRVVIFRARISTAELYMRDGKSIEHAGVTPDELILPTPADLASGRDPVLARAAQLLGFNLPAEDAGKLFPVGWAN